MEHQVSKDINSSISHNDADDAVSKKKQTEYNNVLNELIHTEKSLVGDMEAIYDAYLSPIKAENNYRSLEVCFDSIKGIIETGKCMLEKIDTCDRSPVAIALIFNSVTGDIKTYYGQYCSKYPSSMIELEQLRSYPEKNKKLKHIQCSINHLLPLESYMLKPVQRIMKYPLLLKEMIKLKLLDDEGQGVLLDTQKNMIKVSEYINEQKREMEGISLVDHYNRIITNLPQPMLVSDVGPVQLECEFGKGNKKMFAVLFSKTLILTKPQSDGKLSLHKKFQISDIILLENCSKSATAFEISSYNKPKKKTTFEAKKIEIKEQWITHIKALILENMSLNLNDSKLSALLGEKVGSHVSTILSVKEDVAQARLSSCETLKVIFSDDDEDGNLTDACSETDGITPPTQIPLSDDNEPIIRKRVKELAGSFKESNFNSSISIDVPTIHHKDQALIDKATTAMNILETISDYNIENEKDEDKRKLYENVPWSAQLIQDAMAETEEILCAETDDQSSTHSLSEYDNTTNNVRSSALSRSDIIQETSVDPKTPSRSPKVSYSVDQQTAPHSPKVSYSVDQQTASRSPNASNTVDQQTASRSPDVSNSINKNTPSRAPSLASSRRSYDPKTRSPRPKSQSGLLSVSESGKTPITNSVKPKEPINDSTTAIKLVKRYESLEVDLAQPSPSEKSPNVGESLTSRLQKLFENQNKTSEVVIEKHSKVTPKKASLIGQRLMQLQEKTMTDIQLSRSPRFKNTKGK